METETLRSEAVLPAQLRPPDPESPRGRILDAARSAFAAKGYHGTRTREIADGAGVNLAMVHYYFGSKEQLYMRVLAQEFVSIWSRVMGELRDDVTPEDRLLSIPLQIMRTFRRNPVGTSLLMRELADGAPYLQRAMVMLKEHGPKEARRFFEAAYKEARRSGRIRELPIDAFREFLIAVAYGVMFVRPLFKAIVGRDYDDEEIWSEWEFTVNKILKNGILLKD